MGADSKMMKTLNKKQLRQVLRQCREGTKPELAERTGLSVVTINSLLEEFLESGEVVHAGMAPSGGGRPSALYRYQPDYRYAVLLYGHQSQGKNLIHVSVVNLAGTCVWRKEAYFGEIVTDSFDGIIDEAVEKFPHTGLLAFGLPGEVVDGVVTVHDYEALIGPQFMAHYRSRYGLPVIYENDINAMTYGACRDTDMSLDLDSEVDLEVEAAAETAETAVAGIYLPRIYAPGAGLVIQGRIYYGKEHWAGEISSLPVPVAWDRLDYSNEDDVVRDLEALTAIYGLILAPETLIFYGDFFTGKIQERVKAYGSALFDGKIQMNLIFSENLEQDYEAGMKRLALEVLLEELE